MFPMRCREYFHLPLGYWEQNVIGKAYVRLYPKSEFQYYCQHTPMHSWSGPVIKIPLQMMNYVFPKVILTINSHNVYQLDPNDRNALTQCTVTTPNAYLSDEEQVGGTFSLGYNVFDHSCANFYT